MLAHLTHSRCHIIADAAIHSGTQGLELRARNKFTGQLDVDVAVTGSVQSPIVAGDVWLSRCTVFLMPQVGSATRGYDHIMH